MFGKKFTKEPTEKQKIGKIGEDCACEYLKKQGFAIIDRNYLKKWGEIDIVAIKGKQSLKASSGRMTKIHFVEVKSVSRLFGGSADEADSNVTHVTDDYRPEDNMHPWKLQRLARVIQSYLLDKDIPDDIDWQFDVVTVYIDINKRLSKVFMMEDVVL